MKRSKLNFTYAQAYDRLQSEADNIESRSDTITLFPPYDLPLLTGFSNITNQIHVGILLLSSADIYKDFDYLQKNFLDSEKTLITKYIAKLDNNGKILNPNIKIGDSTFVYHLFKLYHEGEHGRQNKEEYQSKDFLQNTIMRFACKNHSYYQANYAYFENEVKADKIAFEKTYNYLCNECNLKPKIAEKLILQYANYHIQHAEPGTFCLSGQTPVKSYHELQTRLNEQYNKTFTTPRKYHYAFGEMLNELSERMPYKDFIMLRTQVRNAFNELDITHAPTIEYDYLISALIVTLQPEQVQDFTGLEDVNLSLSYIFQHDYKILNHKYTIQDIEKEYQETAKTTISDSFDKTLIQRIKFKQMLSDICEEARQNNKENQKELQHDNNIGIDD